MRRLVAVVTALAMVAVLAATALSLPREIRGSARDDLLTGTPGRDRL